MVQIARMIFHNTVADIAEKAALLGLAALKVDDLVRDKKQWEREEKNESWLKAIRCGFKRGKAGV